MAHKSLSGFDALNLRKLVGKPLIPQYDELTLSLELRIAPAVGCGHHELGLLPSQAHSSTCRLTSIEAVPLRRSTSLTPVPINMPSSYYQDLSANFSRPGLVSDEQGQALLAQASAFLAQKEETLPQIDETLTKDQIESENKAWWPTHCEALRRGRGDLLHGEYRSDLVYFCQDGPFYGLEQQSQREKHWWALISQPGVTMCWPIVMFWGEYVHFEWYCQDDESGEVVAKGTVCWVRRGHRGGCYFKSEQLTFYRDVYASTELLDQLTPSA